MVIQTIRGQAGLQERFAIGQAGTGEYIAGTAHNALGIRVGVRMVRGVPVSGGAFVILSALEITETALRDYGSDEQRSTELAYSVVRNAVSLGLMVAGQRLMALGVATGNLFVVAAGFGIMFLVEPILDVLGVHDLLEEAFAFNPSEVTVVTRDLRKLMEDYRIILGALELARRDWSELTALGATKPAELEGHARSEASRRLDEAHGKEAKILGAFEEAYSRARTSFAGLEDVDRLRRVFLQMQNQVAQTAPAGTPDPTRELAEQTFARIEGNLPLDQMTAAQVAAMEQWQKIDAQLIVLHMKLYHQRTVDLDWENLQKHEHDASLMLRNARYRLEPQALGDHRTKPLLTKGTVAYEAYVEQYERRMRRFVNMQSRLMTVLELRASGSGPPVQAKLPPGADEPLVEAMHKDPRYLEREEHTRRRCSARRRWHRRSTR